MGAVTSEETRMKFNGRWRRVNGKNTQATGKEMDNNMGKSKGYQSQS